MAEGKDWDELDLEAERPAAAKPPPIPGAKKSGGRALRLGWLMALFFGAAGAAVAGLALDKRGEHEAELARARDESAHRGQPAA